MKQYVYKRGWSKIICKSNLIFVIVNESFFTSQTKICDKIDSKSGFNIIVLLLPQKNK